MPKLKTDEQLLKHLEERAPEVLAAKVDFEAIIGDVLKAGAGKNQQSAPSRKRHTNKKHKQ